MNFKTFTCCVALAVTTAASAAAKDTLPFNVDKQLSACAAKVEKSLDAMRVDGRIDYTKDPKDILKGQKNWNLQKNTPDAWTWGFWPGILWMDYQYTKSDKIKSEATNFMHSLEYLSQRPAYDHDLGFLVFLSYEKAYNETGNPAYKQVIINTSDKLAGLFNPKVGTILSWPREAEGNGRYKPYNTIIDNMINLEMLFWASKASGNPRYKEIAVSHANTTMAHHFRKDYSSYHVALYDTLSGKFIKGVTNQGYSDNSMWARGQSWAIYGYTMCYRETGDRKYLDFAQKVAGAYLKNLPKDYVPYWDFNDPAIPNAPRDASAAGVVASAFLELSTYLPGRKGAYYYDYAVKMLKSLSSKPYQSGRTNNAFLLHSTGNYPIHSQIDCSIIYADYYYMEALMRLKTLSEGHKLKF